MNAEDVKQDLSDVEVKIACPTIAIRGEDFDAVSKMFDMNSVCAAWRRTCVPSPSRSRTSSQRA
ncbi:hypothetical protein LGN17_19435 [Burkholderia sp. AU30280]|uniref:hypothetical protein n=1 Tax=Burkholderia sp. AU30280 TaxID=2879628 RepID=UPI001CF27AF1|nr:hypothetical protein [Burkholderia sp. AU30280]